MNGRLVPLDSTVLTWWRDEGGDAVSFGSDAHLPSAVARLTRSRRAGRTEFARMG